MFDEIHVVFEDRQPQAYFFFSDAGALIQAKSQTALNTFPELQATAVELVNAQLATSEVVPDQDVQVKRDERAEREARDQDQKLQWEAENEQKAQQLATQEAEARAASQRSADEALHIDNFMRDVNIMPGERPALVAYLEDKGPARDYWKAKADWYKARRTEGWKVTLDQERVLTKNKPTDKSLRTAHNLPENVKVFVHQTKSGPKHFNVKPELTFPNYTTYAASPLAKKPPV